MTKEHDYEAALEVAKRYSGDGWWCPNCGETDCSFHGNCDQCGTHIETVETDKHIKTIISALKLAARMQRGEKIKTADELLLEMELLIETTTDTPYHPQKNGFKAYAFLLENINRIYSALKIVEQHEEDKTND